MNKTIITILGILFVATGLLGFINNPLLGIFVMDTVHNIVFILSGVLALGTVGVGESATRTFSKIFGIIYLLLGLIGFLMLGNMILGMIMNPADHILHLVLGAIFLYVGFGKKSEMRALLPMTSDR